MAQFRRTEGGGGRKSWLAVAGLVAAIGCARNEPAQQPTASRDVNRESASTAAAGVDPLADADLGETEPAHAVGELYLAGAPTPEDIDLWRQNGVETVVSLLTEDELGWDEQQKVRNAGMKFVHLPFDDGDEVFDRTRDVLRNQSDQPTVLHCMASNRVGAAWLPYRVLDEGVNLDQALAEAREAGLRSSRLEERALEYIERQRATSAAGQ